MPCLQSFCTAYLTQVRQMMPDKRVTSYVGKTLLEVKENATGKYKCLLTRYDVDVEQVSPPIANRSMIELGESLYPIELDITSEGKLHCITNFEEIKERRTDKAKELLSRFPSSSFRKYIEMSQGNLTEEKTLRKALLKDSFIQLFFSCTSGFSFCYTCDNFPQSGKICNYFCEIKKKDAGSTLYVARPAFSYPSYTVMDGNIISETSVKNILVKIKAEFELQESLDSYKREIEISTMDEDNPNH